MLIYLLFGLAWIVLHSIKSRFSANKDSFTPKPDIIPEELDLNSVRDALMEKQGWSLKRAEAARKEYIRFLICFR